MLNFTHHIPTKIYFGKGEISALGRELTGRHKKILLVTGGGSIKRNGVFDNIVGQIKKSGSDYIELSGIVPNPRLSSVYKGIDICKKEGIGLLLAAGGGSVIDAAKAIAAGAKYDGDVWDFFIKDIEIKGALPVAAVLTLAATGSEMNGNTVITNEKTVRKLAFGSPFLRPEFSILDPEYTYTVDAFNTACGIADIMAHIFEQYFSKENACDVQDRMAEALLKVCVKYGPIACKNGLDYDARANIMWASSIALNGSLGEGKMGDWASHYIEHELSAKYDISHGAGLAIIIPSWMSCVLNRQNCAKFAEYAANVWGITGEADDLSAAKKAIESTRSFFESIGLPVRLKDLGIKDDGFETMADQCISDLGRVGNFVNLDRQAIVKILRSSL